MPEGRGRVANRNYLIFYKKLGSHKPISVYDGLIGDH